MKISKKKLWGIVFSLLLVAACAVLFFVTKGYFTVAESMSDAYGKTGNISYYYSSLRTKYFAYLWFFCCFTAFIVVWDWVELLLTKNDKTELKRKIKWILLFDLIQTVICAVFFMCTGVNFVLKLALEIMVIELFCAIAYHYALIRKK